MLSQANQNSSDRRRFLVAAAAIAVGALSATGSDAFAASPGAGKSAGSVMLRPHGNQNLFRVRVELEVEGNVNLPKNALISRKSELQLPIVTAASLDYEEQLRRKSSSDPTVAMANRFYHVAKSQGSLNEVEQSYTLRDSVRETIIRRDVTPELMYSVDDYFDREELDLLRLPVSSLGVDELLPTTAVSVGSTYSPSNDAVASALCLSSVEATEVVAEVVEITASEAKIHFKGNVEGSYEGVPTTVRTVGKLTFDRRIGACTWLAMAVHETREIGKAEPGFDVSATVKMLRKPMPKPVALTASAQKLNPGNQIPVERLYVDLTSREVGLGVLMDRRWRMMADVPGAAMMRMIDNDRSIAQCDFRPLATLPAGSQWTLEAFEQDIKKTLGEQLSDIVSAEERVSETGLRVLRVTASGAVEDVPIQWILMHFSDDSGRRLLATFTMEAKNASTFAGSDHQLGGSLRLIERKKPVAEAISARSSNDGETRIARLNKSNESPKPQVQSASDL
ncbi:hypothetical protein [Rubripirellula reticaptiva]|uniref:Secreted protein n=1 Tax=Rubripirellula reticaptiva TaxID=2528013 RepID=A0A5C6FBS4_9BACT|nr:hypothetical protein [Rubripirellula reticaptiva]TWU58030.1 hypothetical protein Poly59_09390 [Rubripirellula reticaptiva]